MGIFVTWDLALALVEAIRPLLVRIRSHDRDLADQVQRAATSTALV